MQAHGPRATLGFLDHSGQLDTVLNGIASGETAWIRLAHELAQGTDAGDSIGLSVALAQALPANPQAVLAVLDDGPVTGAAVVCSVPLIEPTGEEVKAYLARTIPAVKDVANAAELPLRTPCLQALERIEKQTAGPS